MRQTLQGGLRMSLMLSTSMGSFDMLCLACKLCFMRACHKNNSFKLGCEGNINCQLSACPKRALCRMFATGLARPEKEAGKPSNSSKPAGSLQEKGSLIQAEERATGVSYCYQSLATPMHAVA